MICVLLFPDTLPCAPLLSVDMTKLSRAQTKSISFKTSSSLRRTESGDEFDAISSEYEKHMLYLYVRCSAILSGQRFVYPPIIRLCSFVSCVNKANSRSTSNYLALFTSYNTRADPSTTKHAPQLFSITNRGAVHKKLNFSWLFFVLLFAFFLYAKCRS